MDQTFDSYSALSAIKVRSNIVTLTPISPNDSQSKRKARRTRGDEVSPVSGISSIQKYKEDVISPNRARNLRQTVTKDAYPSMTSISVTSPTSPKNRLNKIVAPL